MNNISVFEKVQIEILSRSLGYYKLLLFLLLFSCYDLMSWRDDIVIYRKSLGNPHLRILLLYIEFSRLTAGDPALVLSSHKLVTTNDKVAFVDLV